MSELSELEVLEEIGGRIRNLRIQKNMTQEELAKKSGISFTTLNRIENGEDTKFSTLVRILIQLGLDDNLDHLVPKPAPDFKKLYEGEKTRQRVRKKQAEVKPWIWGEDKKQ